MRGDTLQLVGVYGDSSDGTGEALFEAATFAGWESHFLEVNHGGPKYGSIVHAARFRQLAKIANVLLRNIPVFADVAIILESDLIWQPGALLSLLDCWTGNPDQCFAPLVFHRDPPDRFYDTFAFRLWGQNFTNDPPYHPALTGSGIGKGIKLLEVESAGSCLVMPAYVARQLNMPERNVIVGFCDQITHAGHKIYVNTGAIIRHP